ncbi:MAG: ATP-binding protein [Verrucomicrobiota bacterium]
MKSTLTARMTGQFALLVTTATAVVLAVGGWLLNRQMLRGLEALHTAEAKELFELIEKGEEGGGVQLGESIVQDTESDAALYFVQIHDREGRIVFRSENLGAVVLPDLTFANLHSTTVVSSLGAIYISEFQEGRWHLQIASPLAPLRRFLDEYVKIAGFLIAGTGLVSLLLGYGFSRFTLRPVRSIRATAARIGSDNLNERIPVPGGGDELSNLARLLNQMFDRLEASFKQVSRFTADASHELKTPLALIRLNAERLRPRLAGDEAALASLEDLLEEIARMNQVIESLLFLAKAEGGGLRLERRPVEMSTLLANFAEDAVALAEDGGVGFALGRNDGGVLTVHAALLRQLLLNLLANAVKASPPGALITLESAGRDGGWELVLSDEGPGLPADMLGRVFERFVRVEQGRKNAPGHGLGLAICQSIAELHGGSVHAENRADRTGLRVVVRLPAGE